jgi:hypothetical protein
MADAAVTVGQPGLATVNTDQLHAYTATARLRCALGHAWAAYAEFNYYDQDLAQALDGLSTMPSILQRNSVSAGVTLWLPLVRK